MSILHGQYPLSDQDFAIVSRVVYEHCGINLRDEKREMVRSRLARLVQKYGFNSYTAYLQFVLHDFGSAEFTEFIDRISTNMTSFFREKNHFDYLRETILPRLTSEQKGRHPPRIRAWSAGCSTGEEPYSIAITIAETLPASAQTNVRILASDISSNVLTAARTGRYPKERLAAVSPALLDRYFQCHREQDHTYYLPVPQLRKMLLFKRINLMTDWPISTQLHFIFCRNVMIYFDKPTQEKLINRLADLLLPDGTLFIGHSESLANIQHALKYIAPTIYQRC